MPAFVLMDPRSIERSGSEAMATLTIYMTISARISPKYRPMITQAIS